MLEKIIVIDEICRIFFWKSVKLEIICIIVREGDNCNSVFGIIIFFE